MLNDYFENQESVFLLECTGSLKLHSLKDDKIVAIYSRKIKSKTKLIGVKGMRFAVVSGGCCWEVRSRLHGGDYMHLKTAEIHSLPWDIKLVKLVKCTE